ncbi:MAG: dihydroorotate dehydrogenase electron transfer subunit [Oscillospiraceae bacterium]|nr:dihydroorotate dehydrogenase electron transfer subunit [Oscillospiraceae bacterium]
MNYLCEVVSNKKLTESIFDMYIDAPKIAETALPGQFLHIKCKDLTLRRPLSIAETDSGGRVRICYEVRGEGTAWLSGLGSGGKIDIMGPLGKGFDIPEKNKKILLAGGGIGIYPLYPLALKYKTDACAALGFKTKTAVNFEAEFRAAGCKTVLTTDDGSYGSKGFVTDSVKDILNNNKIDLIAACGPKAMMRGVYNEAKKHGIRCLVSLEERMACGVGACLACVCRVNKTNKRVCSDGPVFCGDEVDWDYE